MAQENRMATGVAQQANGALRRLWSFLRRKVMG